MWKLDDIHSSYCILNKKYNTVAILSVALIKCLCEDALKGPHYCVKALVYIVSFKAKNL